MLDWKSETSLATQNKIRCQEVYKCIMAVLTFRHVRYHTSYSKWAALNIAHFAIALRNVDRFVCFGLVKEVVGYKSFC